MATPGHRGFFWGDEMLELDRDGGHRVLAVYLTKSKFILVYLSLCQPPRGAKERSQEI